MKPCRVYRREVSRIMTKMQNGTARPCFAVDFLKAADEGSFPFDETQKLFTLGSLIEAGSDTSRMVIGQVIAAAAVYPDWVKRARKELDAVCGQNAERLPNFDDKAALPYITAVVKESLRWRPIVEIGVPHMLTEDDEYEGYRFPAGTIFTWNSFAIALDPNEYEDPERFYPERFLNEDLANPVKGHWAFGPGGSLINQTDCARRHTDRCRSTGLCGLERGSNEYLDRCRPSIILL
jgi:cytochrome P450